MAATAEGTAGTQKTAGTARKIGLIQNAEATRFIKDMGYAQVFKIIPFMEKQKF